MSIIQSQVVNSYQPSHSIGFIPKHGGLAIGTTALAADLDLHEIAFLFRSGDPNSGKVLILEGADGNPVVYTNVASGEEIVFETKKIIHSASVTSVNGDVATYTTDIVLLTWGGGQ